MGKASLLLQFRDKQKQSFFIYGLGQAFNLLSPLIVAPYIISVCDEEGLGKIGLGFAMALFLILIVDYSFEIKGIKEISEKRDDIPSLEKIVNRTIFTKITLFLFALILATTLICAVPFFRQEKALFFFSLFIVLAQVFNPVWILQGLEKFAFASFLNIGSKILYVTLVFCFVLQKSDYIMVNMFLGLSSLLFNVIGLIIIRSSNKFLILRPNLNEVREILRTDFTFCVSQLFLSVRQLSPLLLASYFLGFHIAGQYKVMEQIITFFRTFIQVFLKFFYPSVCYKMLSGFKTGYDFWKKYSVLNFICVLFAVCLILIFSDDVLRFFNLSELTIQNLNPIFRISLIVSILMAVSLPLEQMMFLANKNKIYIRITIFVTIINVFTILILINSFKLYGIVAALILSEILFISFYFKNAIWPNKSQLL